MFPLNYDNTGVTVELGRIVEQGVNIWDFEYPSFYKGAEKTAFEQKVIDHYRFRQIGQETVGRFLHCFRSRIRDIMPYYLQLYKSQEIMDAIEDPFGNIDIVETFEQETTGTSTGTNTGTSSGTSSTDYTHKFSNTPQQSISNIELFMSEAAIDKTDNSDENESSVTSTGESSGTVRHTFTKKGNQGVNTYAHDMKEFRETFLNIDLMVIEDLNCLFLQVY